MGVLKRVMQASGIPKEDVGRLFQGHSIASLKGMDQKLMDAIYSLGHQHYESDKLETARSLMRYLCVHDHRNPEYLAALGACEYRLKNYPQALKILSQAAELDSKDPRIMLNLGLCLIKNKQKKEARPVMKAAEALSAEQGDFQREWTLASRILTGSGKKQHNRNED